MTKLTKTSREARKLAAKKRYWTAAFNLIFGLLMVNAGDFILETGWDFKHDMPVYNWVGLVTIVSGLPFIGYGIYLLFKTPQTLEPPQADYICPECESVYSLEANEEHVCPNDGTTMEPLKGYYDRHPDRRDKPVTPNK